MDSIFKEKKKKEEKKEKKRCVAQQRVNLTKKEGIFAKQTDTFTVLNFPT